MSLTITHQDDNLEDFDYSFEDLDDGAVILNIVSKAGNFRYRLFEADGFDREAIKSFLTMAFKAAQNGQDLRFIEDPQRLYIHIVLNEDNKSEERHRFGCNIIDSGSRA